MYLPPKFKVSPAIPSTNACSSAVFLFLFCRIAKAKVLKKEVGPNRWWYKSDLVGTKGSFKNYVDKMRWVGGEKMLLFVLV